VDSLRCSGFSLVDNFVPKDMVDRLYAQADAMFRDLRIDFGRAYSVQTGQRRSLQGLSYEELAATEKMIALADPLLHIPELLDVAFDERILKIAANFLGGVPPLYRVTVVRDFPHNRPLHSSNFHKDNDESDSLQIFVYLVDIDDSRGPLVYIPGSNRYDVRSRRPAERRRGRACLSAQRVGRPAHGTRQSGRDSRQRNSQGARLAPPRRFGK